MATPLLGYITVPERTPSQEAANEAAKATMPRFALSAPDLPKGTKACLYDAWRHADVVREIGFVFPRFHQLTGSCVGAGGGQALFSLIATQRLLSQGATKAFIPWWPFDYGKSRLRGGWNTPGEGSMGATFAEAVVKDGVMSAGENGLPQFNNEDGLTLTKALELEWSDGDSSTVMKWNDVARVHPVGNAAELRDVSDIKAAILNGYPVTFACSNYIGHASVEGSGADACVIGYWDGSGGHQQSIHGYWEHPNFGPLYWAQNNWPGSTYPKDPAGGPVCGCWVREAKVAQAMRLYGEVYGLSHLTWFPAQPVLPEVLDWGKL